MTAKLLQSPASSPTSQMTGMYAIDSDGNLRAFVGAGQEGVKIKADHIQLEGIVTANGNFKILEDGSIETVNGKFTGEVNATSGKIGGFIIGANSITAEEATRWKCGWRHKQVFSIFLRRRIFGFGTNTDG